ncbi:MAG: hypothetical protein ACRCRZ_01305, partial [Metamycoplasmataceae bacterium]
NKINKFSFTIEEKIYFVDNFKLEFDKKNNSYFLFLNNPLLDKILLENTTINVFVNKGSEKIYEIIFKL